MSLIALSQERRATLAPLQARYDAACSAIAVARLNLPAELVAPATAVQDAIPEIDAAYRGQDYAAAETRCTALVTHLDELKTSKLVEIRSLWGKADTLCSLLVPVATLEAALKMSACDKQRVQHAYTVLARAQKLDSPAVSPLVAKWNQACPRSVLAID
ncbi:MAG: hypothetical protein M3680_25625 [Myxococcota bacterium]|nr:hypothetical protein [Myxococcota bacterium]